jgi:hypothetical protein
MAAGATQYWTQGNQPPLGAGTNNIQLPPGLGYPWRMYLFELVRTAGTRANGALDFPDPLVSLKFEANMLLTSYQKTVWQQRMMEQYGYTNPAPSVTNTVPADVRNGDVAGVGTAPASAIPGLENGVFSLNWNKDFAFDKIGSETRRTYLVTSPGSNFVFNGSLGNAGTLFSIVNYIANGGKISSDTGPLTGGH